MSVKVSVHQLQNRLPELLDDVVNNEEECVVQRNGKDCAVIVSTRQCRRRTAGKLLDDLGADYRLPRPKQARAEQLLAASQQRSLTVAERSELKKLLRDSDAIMLGRAAALEPQPLYPASLQVQSP